MASSMHVDDDPVSMRAQPEIGDGNESPWESSGWAMLVASDTVTSMRGPMADSHSLGVMVLRV